MGVKRKWAWAGLAVAAAVVVAISLAMTVGSSGDPVSKAPATRAYWYQAGENIAAAASDVNINTANTGGPPTSASGWCADVVFNRQPQAVSQWVSKYVKLMAPEATATNAQEFRWLMAGCQAQYND